jgi:DNA polymerase-4
VRARFPEGRLLTRSQTLPTPAAATAAIEKTARRLLRQAMGDCDDPVTLVGIALSGLENDSGLQLELGWDTGEVDRAGTAASDTALAIDRQVDEIRRRFGVGAITRAGLIGRDDTNAPDDFRRLAERD